MGFSYDGGAASGSDELGSEGQRSSGASGGSDAEGGPEGGAGREADGLAANLGIESFGVLLRRAEREEEAAADGQEASRKRTCVTLNLKTLGCASLGVLISGFSNCL